MLAVLTMACSSQPTTAPSTDALGSQLDPIFEPWNLDDSPGAAVVVWQHGKPLYERGVGVASLTTKTLIDTASTRFDIASVSKQMTAYAVQLLASRGVLSLDDKARTWLPWLPEFAESITLRQLILHTSGLREYLLLVPFHRGSELSGPLTQEDVRQWLRDQRELNFAPGSQHMYSNTGYVLLADVVAAAARQPFADFMREEVFEPLGMGHSRVRTSNDTADSRAHSYGPREDPRWFFQGRFEAAPESELTRGDGGVETTANDLMLWLEHLRTPQANQKVVAAMKQRGSLTTGKPFDYASGLRPVTIQGVDFIYHGGGILGYRSWAGFAPDLGLSIVILGNSFPGIGGLEQPVIETLCEHLGNCPEADAESRPAENLEAWVGHYADDTFRGEISLQDGQLMYGSTRGLRPIQVNEDGRFRIATTEFSSDFGADGRVTSLRFFYGAQEVTLERFEPVTLDSVDLTRYVGRYKSAELGVIVDVVEAPSGLKLTVPGQSFTYIARKPDRFYVERGRASSVAFAPGSVSPSLRWNLIRSRNMRFDRLVD